MSSKTLPLYFLRSSFFISVLTISEGAVISSDGMTDVSAGFLGTGGTFIDSGAGTVSLVILFSGAVRAVEGSAVFCFGSNAEGAFSFFCTEDGNGVSAGFLSGAGAVLTGAEVETGALDSSSFLQPVEIKAGTDNNSKKSKSLFIESLLYNYIEIVFAVLIPHILTVVKNSTTTIDGQTPQ
ncbi:MAG: hypothetical protein AB1401_02285 [Thermodesulfobacteriota bacterium]